MLWVVGAKPEAGQKLEGKKVYPQAVPQRTPQPRPQAMRHQRHAETVSWSAKLGEWTIGSCGRIVFVLRILAQDGFSSLSPAPARLRDRDQRIAA